MKIMILNLFMFFLLSCMPSDLIEKNGEAIMMMEEDGHYYCEGYINDFPVDFLFDTGATYITIGSHIAEKAKLKKGKEVKISTASGLSIGYSTTIDKVKIGNIKLINVDAIINPNLELNFDTVLLGMNVLQNLEITQKEHLFAGQILIISK